jgi:uncharacterized protein YwbE
MVGGVLRDTAFFMAIARMTEKRNQGNVRAMIPRSPYHPPGKRRTDVRKSV